MTNGELANQFVATFRRAIEAEKAALRQDSSAYEVPLEGGKLLSEMTQGEQTFYAFQLTRPSERVTPGVACSLREPTGLEVPVTVVQISGTELVLRSEVRLSMRDGSYRLLFVPWFLYDEMHAALEKVPFAEMALRAFGKQPVSRETLTLGEFEHDLNPTEQQAVRLALASQLSILWGPPGTGKTTTLAQLIAFLVAHERRVLITSTTHAALDQALSRLEATRALEEVFARHQVIQLGHSGQPCSLDEVVNATQVNARATLDRSRQRLEAVVKQLQDLLPVLLKAQEATARSHQRCVFAEAPGALDARDLTPLLGGERGGRWARLGAEQQCELSSGHWRPAGRGGRRRRRRSPAAP